MQVRCVDIIYIDFFSLFHYYLKAKIIYFITYTNISADHITTEFIIIKLISESKNVKEPYNWHVLVFQYGDAIDFFHSSVKSDYTFFPRKENVLISILNAMQITSSTYIFPFLNKDIYHSDAGM